MCTTIRLAVYTQVRKPSTLSGLCNPVEYIGSYLFREDLVLLNSKQLGIRI